LYAALPCDQIIIVTTDAAIVVRVEFMGQMAGDVNHPTTAVWRFESWNWTL